MSDYYTSDQMAGAVKNAKRDYILLKNCDDGETYKVQLKKEDDGTITLAHEKVS